MWHFLLVYSFPFKVNIVWFYQGGAWVLPVDGLMDKGRVKKFLQPYAKYESQRIELYSVWFVQGNEFFKSTFEMNFFLGRHQLTSIK